MRLSKVLLFGAMIFLFFTSVNAFNNFASASSPITFGTVQVLSNTTGNSTAPVVATVGSNVYVAWEEKPSANQHIATYFTRSTDDGGTFSTPISFTGSAFPGGATPQTSAVQIAVVGSYVFLTWSQGGLTAFAISSDSGASFPQAGIFQAPAGSQSGEAVAACNTPNGIYAYFTWSDMESTSRPVLAQIYSAATGKNLSAPKVISTGTTQSSHGEDEVACAANTNNVYVVWDSIYVTASTNNGGTFYLAPKQIRPSGGSGGTLSREPMVAACGSNAYVTFPSNVPGSYQTFVVVNNQNGLSTGWSTPKDLSISTLSNAREVQVTCTGADVYITSRGQLIGQTGIEQFVYVSSDSGATFTTPTLLGPKLPNPENGFGGVAVDGSGGVYVQWIHNAKAKGVQQIFIAASQDSGATWSPNQQVSQSVNGVVGYGDPSGGQGPMVATSPGHIYSVWIDTDSGNWQVNFMAST